jgi:hypothetical protein
VAVDVSTARDVIIIILGCLYIILTIGIIVGLIFVFLKIKHLINSINNKLKPVYRWMCVIRNFARGTNQYAKVFK